MHTIRHIHEQQVIFQLENCIEATSNEKNKKVLYKLGF